MLPWRQRKPGDDQKGHLESPEDVVFGKEDLLAYLESLASPPGPKDVPAIKLLLSDLLLV